MTEREKQIEEMARAMCFQREHCDVKSCVEVNCEKAWLAEKLYNAGYRKQRCGEWLEQKGEQWISSEVCQTYTYYECSVCDGFSKRKTNFCPNCGAFMKKNGR